MIAIRTVLVIAVGGLALGATGRAAPEAGRYFAIEVVDEQTGRGVPLVELRTTNHIRYVTDSAGVAAFHEPGLMDRDVFFHVSSHGYEFPADGFGNRGKKLRTTPGATARLTVRRINLAERLYRITGQGIYRDTILLGRKAPVKEPLLNGQVMGQDTVQVAEYRGRFYWFWGDTNRPSYPLGHFATSGAVSELPGKGGLEPGVGVNLTYFVDKSGFSRKMAPFKERGMIWIHALLMIEDPSGRQRLLGHFGRMKSLGERVEHGLVVFNDETETFERLVTFPQDARLAPGGQTTRATVDGTTWYYFTPSAHPLIRVQADWKHVLDPKKYQAFTCLAEGSGYEKDAPKLDRDAGGRLVWAWKTDTGAIGPASQKALISRGHIKPAEAWIRLRDVETGKPVTAHRGSVRWNEFRHRWVMIFVQAGGTTSYLGEVWYAEADAPEGPWLLARKIVTHERYSFYNPVHHAFFDRRGGRIIHFEGTYTRMFSAAKAPTPRYDYNQILYRLDLADPRLAPVQGK